MNVVLLEARRPPEQRALQDEMVRVWSQLEAMDAESARRVLTAMADMRREILDRLTQLPTVAVGEQETFASTALQTFTAELEEITRRFEQRYSASLGDDMRAVAALSDEAHRAALSQLARALDVPPAIISFPVLGLDSVQMQAAALLNQGAIKGVSQATVQVVNREVQRVVFGAQSRWEAVKNIRDALSTDDPRNLGALTTRALTIERTALIQVFSIAQDHAYREALEELPDLRVTWLSARDRRVDPKCVAMDGKTKHPRGTFPGGVIAPPLHPRCRCRMIPNLPGWPPMRGLS